MRSFLAALLMFTLMPAWAAWVKVSENDGVTYYIDPTSIRKYGDIVRVWELTDRDARGGNGSLSERWLKEHDCKQGQSRRLSVAEYSERMLTGRMMGGFDVQDERWTYVRPDSIGEDLWKFACSK